MLVKSKFRKFIFSGLVLFYFFSIFIVQSASAQMLEQTTKQALEAQTARVQINAGFSSSATVGSVVATVIKGFLGLLGIIFVFLMVLAGYHWMTAAGDQQKITKAQETLRAAIIGIIIIVAAYSITYFVIKYVGTASGV